MILGQLHLELALRRPGPVGKDVQNQAVAVDDPAGQGLLQRPPLGGGQLVVEDDQVDVVGGDEIFQLPAFSLADKGMGIGGMAVLHGGEDALAPGGLDQLGQLGHGLLVGVVKILGAVAGQAHQQGPAPHVLPFFQHTHRRFPRFLACLFAEYRK